MAPPALTSPAGKICNGDLQSYFCRDPSSHSHTLFSQIHRMPAPLASGKIHKHNLENWAEEGNSLYR